ncbi:MAG: type II secretion system F family protein [Clostridiales bacterium]|nr:type II secretion system F family protein [Clostridiales bacterium]
MRTAHRRRAFTLVIGMSLAVGIAVAPIALASAVAKHVLVAQSVDSSEYPTIALTITLPVEMLAGGEGETAFTVLENTAEREILSVEPLAAARAPMDVLLLIDTSGSMQGTPMADAKTAARAFVAAKGAGDEIAIVSFDSEAEVRSAFTNDRAALNAAIDTLEARGNTALYDGVVKSAGLLSARQDRERVILLLSDGGDTASANTLDEAVGGLVASGAPVYAVGLETPETDMGVLATIAEQSRGRLIEVADSGDLERLYADVARELTTQYRLTFRSAQPNTTQLDLQVLATVNGRAGTTSFVVNNPHFQSAAGVGTGIEPASPLTSVALASLITLLAFSAAALTAWSVLGMVVGRTSRLDDLRFYDQLSGAKDTTNTPSAGLGGIVREAVAVVAGRRGLTQLVHQKLDRAGLPLRPVEYMYLHLVGVVVAGVVTQVLAGSFVLSLVVVGFATALPVLLLESVITRRRRAFDDQLPEILSMMASSLRAGWGIQQSIDLVAQEIGDPAASEFRRVLAGIRLGQAVEDALDAMAERLDSDDFRWTVTAIAIQREVGGNLAEVLDLVASTMRERAELRRHIKALTSEGRLSAVILFVLPFVMMGLLLVVNPGYMTLMFNTFAGWVLLIAGAVLLVVGGFWLRRVAEVEI